MNTKQSLLPQKVLFLIASLGTAASTQAGFQYQVRDLVIGFRQSGGSSEVVVNAGSISNFTSLPVGNSMTISNLDASQLATAFADLNDLSWSAAADVRSISDPTYPYNTIWVTRPRSDINVQTSPWLRKSETTLGNAAAKIDGIAGNTDTGAVGYGLQVSTGPNNTSTGIIIPAGLQNFAYSYFMGSGNYLNTFQGNAETPTPSDFTTAGLPVRADLYELRPGTGSGTYLGFFELNTNGVLTYKSGPSSVVVPPPAIVSVDRAGSLDTITFTTVIGAQYILRYSDDITSPVSTWATIGSPIAGDGTNKQLTDTTSTPHRFYAISAQ